MPPHDGRTAPDDTAVIRAALPALRRASDLPVVFGGAVAGNGRARYTELSGTLTDAIRGLVVDPGRGLGGKSLVAHRPMWVRDYVRATSISHDYDAAVTAEGLRALVAVPIVVRNRARGVLLGALRQSVPIGERTVAAVVATAREMEQDLAVRDEARRRLVELERTRPAEEGASRPRWEEIRELNAELRTLAGGVTDPDLRDRRLDLCSRMAATATPDHPRPPAPRLTRRELDVLSCVALGCTNAATADQLALRPETVKSYLRSAMRKLDAHTRLEAVTAARRTGLLP